MRKILVLLAAFLGGMFVYYAFVSPGALAPDAKPRLGGSLTSGPVFTANDVARSADLSADEMNNIDIYQRANPATVNITSVEYTQNFWLEVVPREGAGSGFLIHEDGLVLTNNHVLSADGSQVEVTLMDQSRYRAKVLARDPENDLALMKIEAGRKLPFLKLGDSDTLRVGQKVLAIGNPFSLGGTLTTGIVSALGRSLPSGRDTVLEDVIQTDAAINPGNSGGPLLDSHGDVIGINTAIYGAGGNIGIGFAMPISRAKAMLEVYQERGEFVRPWLGLRSHFVNPELARYLELPEDGGYLVVEAVRGGSGALAGIRGASSWLQVGNYRVPWGGDFITGVDGRPVNSSDVLKRVMAKKRVGDRVRFDILREGRKLQVDIPLREAPRR
ncbi:MAG: trypsin-like peptidase domain-containing protein [Bryobacterales bacterium]|jgi:putative serine protease PepD|nr:trypsin-like peptidase domain-containing protein [Bryobacterales bacterium]